MSREASHAVHRFRTMGTSAELHMRAPEAEAAPLFAAAERELGRICSLMTRFEPASPIEQINDAGEGHADGELLEVLKLALDAWHATSGRFDVGVGGSLIAAGYDRDFAQLELPEDGELPQSTGRPVVEPGINRAQTSVRSRPPYTIDGSGYVVVEPGLRIDLGGIGKGWGADHVCRMLSPHGSCLVNLGGDIALSVVEGEDPWPVGVELGDRDVSLAIAWGGLATSGQDRRVWRDAATGELAHHIIDPSTGRPVATDILRITVFAASCAEAEVLSKSLMMVGVDAAMGEAQAWNITSVVIGLDGRVVATGGLADLNL